MATNPSPSPVSTPSEALRPEPQATPTIAGGLSPTAPVAADHTPAGRNPNSAFSTLCRHLTRAPVADGATSGEVRLRDDGLHARGDVRGRVGLEARARRAARGALGEAQGELQADLGARGHANGRAHVGVRGASAAGQAGAEVRGRVRGRAEARTALGAAEAELQAELAARGRVQGEAIADLRGVSARVEGEATARAGADVSAHARSIGTRVGGQDVDVRVTVKGRAEVSATAQGEAKADLRFAEGGPKLGVDLGGEAFAGAKAEGQVQVGLGEIASVTAHGGAWAGAGAEGRARVHFDKGKLKLGVSGGAAAEAGAGGGVEVEVDVVKGAFVAAGAGLKSLTAPVRFALNPAGVLMDACTSARMALSLGTQLATIPGQLLQAAAG